MLSISDLFTPLTAAQFRAKMVQSLLVLGVPADQWRVGGVASTILTVASMILELMSGIIAGLIQDFFLPTATGIGLKALALFVYGVTPPDATYATGNITLTNIGGGVYTKAVGAFSVSNPVTGATYVNAVAFTLTGTSTLSVAMRAVDAGSAGSSLPNTITNMVTILLGVSCNNPASFVGTDAPTDAAIRALCVNKLGAMSVRGVRTAYAYAIQVAINPVTMGPVNINRWAISESSHTGEVTLSVAAPSGMPDTNDLTGIRTAVERYARPSGVSATTVGATGLAYAPTVTVWVTPATGTVAADIKAAIDASILNFLKAYPIGGVTAADDAHPATFTGLFGSGITGAIDAGARSVGATVLSVRGAPDLALTGSQVATDGVVITLILVAPSSGVLA